MTDLASHEWDKPLTAEDARSLTAEICTAVQKALPLIRTAFQRRADFALGYGSWDEYCDAELSGLRLAVADRQEAVAGLRADGMSTRAIGSALGVDPKTVRNDLAQVGTNSPPDAKVIGTDRKQHPATRPTQTPGPVDSTTSPADPGTAPAPAFTPPSAPAREPAPTPGPDAAPSTAPSGPGPVEAVAPATREGAGATAEAERSAAAQQLGIELDAWLSGVAA